MTYSPFPEIEPYRTGRLKVSALHEIHFEEVGNPNGKPVIFVHGGPGGGTEPSHRRYFNPKVYRVILFDQRGCGQSLPYAELRENTTWDLIGDMEKLRVHLGIDKWMVFGGSWGSTLGLLYAETHPERVSELVLRGIFLCRNKEIRWFYQDGASHIFPDVWDGYLAAIPKEEHGDLVKAYYSRLTSADRGTRLAAARAWSTWEGATSRLIPDPRMIQDSGEDEFAEAFARIECHYFTHGIWMRHDNQILEDVHKIRHIPCEIVHGRYDVVCPVENAWDLKKAWPEARLHIVPDAGHSAREEGILKKLIEATER
ncbi:MAG TPA: prolyl aminopeptidase, partial [Bdellovibrionales bacterium]|nr:prolyl aminopeptidase [Bdellovibrionales bacterium]